MKLLGNRRAVLLTSLITAVVLLHVSSSQASDGEPYNHDAPVRDVAGLTGFAQGELALRMQDPARAAAAFRRTTQVHPNLPIAWLKLAEALRRSGDTDDAYRALDRAEQKGASSWELGDGRAKTALADGDASLALAFYREADWFDAPPEYFDDWFELATTRADELAARRAGAAFTNAHPASARSWRRLGNVLRIQGYLESAIYPLQQASSLAGGSAEASEEAASVFIQLGRYEHAIRESEFCIGRYRDQLGCYRTQVQAHYAVAHGASAEHSGHSVADESSVTESSVWSDGLTAAIEALARMTSATPRMAQATGRDLINKTSGEIAIRYAEIVVRLRPYNRNMREIAGWLAAAAGNESKAIEFFEQYFELDDSNSSALNFVGYTLAERGERLHDAERYIRRALELEDNDPNIKDSLGWVLFKRGRLRDALTVQLEAVEALPTNAVILDHLGDIYHGLGRESEAREAWRKALDFATPDDEDVLETVPEKLRLEP